MGRLLKQKLKEADVQSDLEIGYYCALEIVGYCQKKGINIGLMNGKLTFDHRAVEPALEAKLREYKEHLKLFFLNGGQPPPGVVMLGPVERYNTEQIRSAYFEVQNTKSI